MANKSVEKSMITTTLAGDKTVQALAARLVKENLVAKPADEKALENAIFAANPHLHDIAKLPAGTPVVLPKTIDAPAGPARGDALVQAVVTGLGQTLTAGRAIFDAGAAFTEAKLGALQTPEVQQAISDLRAKDAALADKLSQVSDAATTRASTLTTVAAARTKAISSIQTRITAVSSSVSKSSLLR
jgi:hypothetical protein